MSTTLEPSQGHYHHQQQQQQRIVTAPETQRLRICTVERGAGAGGNPRASQEGCRFPDGGVSMYGMCERRMTVLVVVVVAVALSNSQFQCHLSLVGELAV